MRFLVRARLCGLFNFCPKERSLIMNRKERRALAHQERKLANKLARAAETENRTLNVRPASPALLVPSEGHATAGSVLRPIAHGLDIPEPGGVFPPLSAITPSLQPQEAVDEAASKGSATDTPTIDTSGPSPISNAQLAANRAKLPKVHRPQIRSRSRHLLPKPRHPRPRPA